MASFYFAFIHESGDFRFKLHQEQNCNCCKMQVENGCCETFQTENENCSDLTDLPQVLQNCIASIVKNEGFVTQVIKTKKITTEGGNFLAVLYEIDIKGETHDAEKEVNLFVKQIIPVTGEITGFFTISDAYASECYVYKELVNIFKKLQDKANIPAEDRYKIVKGYDESNTQLIILENVAKKGYVACDKIEVIPLKFAELSIEQLAKFHALGFAIEKEMPDYFNKKISKMENPSQFNKSWHDFMNNLIVSSISSLNGNAKIKAETFREIAHKKYAKMLGDKSTLRTLCHGDFRAGNILMKKTECEVTDVIPVDFQIVHYGCPMNDFLYFIYGCTDREFRRQHMQNLLNLYYDTLTRFLKYFDIDVHVVYPRSVFEAALKDRADMGLMIALMFYPFYFASEDSAPNISEGIKKEVNFEPNIVRRIEEFVEELEELGIL